MVGVLSIIVALGFAGLALFAFIQLTEERKARRIAEQGAAAAARRSAQVEADSQRVSIRNAQLEPFAGVADTTAEVERLRGEAASVVAAAAAEAAGIKAEARAYRKRFAGEAEAALRAANERAADVVAEAERRARETAGEAMDAVRFANLYEQTAKAMKNLIDGYGDAYLRPARSLLDDLADDMGHKEAGQRLKAARQQSAALVKAGGAATCDYVETARRIGAEHFVIDAFNGKVDSILSRSKHDNAGTLEAEIRDAFVVVNYGGRPFRNARVTDAYLDARLAELQWAAIAHELRIEEREERRRLRETIREEERARREYERAMKEAVKEERILQKAMEKARTELAAAGEAQRATLEGKLAELSARLAEAEEKNRRAISMAQQTRRGHVYVISNVGSFGENVYKIGLTRRLEPLDRVKELGDSSVPFEFDVHALIYSDDAPALEHRLHKHFVRSQINKVNHRKEFFRASLAEVRREIEQLGIESRWTMTAEASDYRETLAIERMIADDPAAMKAWTNRQLVLEATAEDDEDEPATD